MIARQRDGVHVKFKTLIFKVMELQEFIKKYGQEFVQFRSYYKCSFTFTGKCRVTGNYIFIDIGGSHDDIYEISIDSNPVQISSLDLDLITYARVMRKDGGIYDEIIC